MAGVKARRCPEGYGAKSLRFLREAKARGMHLRHDGRLVLPAGKVHEGTPSWGRDRVNIGIDGENLTVQVARAVCFLAHGEPPSPTCVADHIDGNTLNDHPDNLRWATYSENVRNNKFTRQKTPEMEAAELCGKHGIKRVRACIAACAGTPTETLEDAAAATGFAPLINDAYSAVDKTRARLAEAERLLKEFVECPGDSARLLFRDKAMAFLDRSK